MAEKTSDLDEAIDVPTAEVAGAELPHHSFFSRLYTGTGGFDVMGRRKLLFGITALLVAIGAAGTGSGGDGRFVTTLETGAGEDAISGAAGVTSPKCCFKYKAAPKTSNASSNNAKTNFGLINCYPA